MRFEYSKQFVKDNLIEHWQQCSFSFIEEHKNWYDKTRKWLNEFREKKKLDIPIEVIIGTFSALSPQCSFRQNKEFLEHFYKGFQKHTSNQHNKAKEINKLYGEYVEEKRVLEILNGYKTQRFFLNILYPFENKGVTVDSHCIAIAGYSQKSVTSKQYLFLEEQYSIFAEENNLLPHQMQSCLWVLRRQNLEKDKFYD